MSGSKYDNPLLLNDVGTTSDPIGIGLNPAGLEGIDRSTLRIVTYKEDLTFLSITQGATGINTQGPPLEAGNYLLAFMVPDTTSPEPSPESTVNDLQATAKVHYYASVDFQVAASPPPPQPPIVKDPYTVNFGEPLIFWVSFSITQGSVVVNPNPNPNPHPNPNPRPQGRRGPRRLHVNAQPKAPG